MKKSILIIATIIISLASMAQFTKASLRASGLTCAMCSKAVKVALEKVPFVQEVKVNIKTQDYLLTFKEGSDIEFDALKDAVEDAGFSVAALKITALFNGVTLEKDKHLVLGGKSFHFLNANNESVNGEKVISIVDKDFVSAREFKKYSAATRMECVRTGKAGNCCTKDGIGAETRVYHVII
jgi:copper chaperone CopZ